jgi:hypothetical protein
LEDRKCFHWWVQKHLKPFAVQWARKSQITLKEDICLRELHLLSLGAYSLVWMLNTTPLKRGFVISDFCFLTSSKHKYSLCSW